MCVCFSFFMVGLYFLYMVIAKNYFPSFLDGIPVVQHSTFVPFLGSTVSVNLWPLLALNE